MTTNMMIAMLVMSVGFAACGGEVDGNEDSASNTGSPDAGVDNNDTPGTDANKDDKPAVNGAVSALTPAERLEICQYAAGLVSNEDNKKLACVYDGLFEAATPAECQPLVDACMAEEYQGEDCSGSDFPLPTCASQVTVEEYKACLKDSGEQTAVLAAAISCTSEDEDNEDELPSCALVFDKCPDLLTGGAPGDETAPPDESDTQADDS